MGLDLLHLKLVKDPVDTTDRWLFDELPRPPDQHTWEPYVQPVRDSESLYRVLFAPTLDALDILKSTDSDGTASFLLGKPEDNEEQLRSIELNHGLHRHEAWFGSMRWWRNGNWLPYTSAHYSRETTSRGVYYIEVGYQRKGMTQQFYDDYHGELFAERHHFERLVEYLIPEYREELLPNLLENFVRKYEPGVSLLFVSR